MRAPRLLLSFVTLTAAVAAQAGDAEGVSNRVTAIEVAPHGGNIEIAIRGKTAPEFTLTRLTNPTRVVVDLPGTDVASVRPPELDAQGIVTGIAATQFRGRSGSVGRVVIGFRGDIEIDAHAKGDAVVLSAHAATSAGTPTDAAPAPRAPTARAPAPTTPVIEIDGDGDAPKSAHSVVDVSAKQRDGGSLIAIQTDGKIDRYEIEELDSPPRLVVDIYGVGARKGLERAFDVGAVASARVGRHADKARVVLDGRGAFPRYDVAATDEGLTLVFSGAAATKTTAVDLKNVAFEDKGSFRRVRLDIGGAVAVRTVSNGPDQKVIALDGVRAADRFIGPRGFSGGSVAGVAIARDERRADSIRITLDVRGDVEHSVWQKDGAVFWDVRAAAKRAEASAISMQVERAPPDRERIQADRAQPQAAPFSTEALALMRDGQTAATFRGKKVTIDLMDADIINVIRLIGDVSGKNVVVGDEVKGRITLKLKNVPWDQALDVILRTKGLGQETKGGIIRVVKGETLEKEREDRLKLADEREKKMPTTVRLIPVNYAVAAELVPQVKELLSARGKATNDARTNVIIVEDIRDNLEQAERLVRTLDTQTPQVLIEARMVESSTNFTRALGIQWGGGLFFSQRGGNPTGLVFPNNVGISGAADTPADLAAAGVVPPPGFAVNLPSAATNSGIGLNLGSVGNFGFLNIRLTAAEANGEAKVISAPRVTTLNNKKARISQGTSFTVAANTTGAASPFTTVEANLSLDVTPHVTADGSVLMTIQITNNRPNIAAGGAGVPPVDTKQAQTEMLVKDGDTAVIGGIYTRNQGENFNQTPFLGSIPILGWLFKSYQETDARTEMIVFITPRIVNRRGATTAGGSFQ